VTALRAADPPATAARPNVLFIAVDDLNDWVGFLGGYADVKTPNIDRLAARGMMFARAYCSAPACNPSRASLLCGVAPSTSGVYHNNQPWRKGLPNAVTLPRYFMNNGYTVVGGGKIFHGGFPDSRAWNESFHPPRDPQPPNRPVNGLPRTAQFDWGPVDEPDERMADYKIVDWAIEQLGRKREKPAFVAVGLHKPHLPWYVPRKYFDLYPLDTIKRPAAPADDLEDVPAVGRQMARPQADHRRVVDSKNWDKAVQGYLASIAFADAQIGRLIDALDKSPAADRTIVVLWGDHGWHLGEKQHWRKFALWEEATRVPLAIVAPGVTKPGTRCERTVSLIDLYPTLVELCGLPSKSGLEGRSLRPLLADPTMKWDRPVVTTHGRGNHAIRSERYRYIRYHDGGEELYDHQADPLEHKNLAGDPKLAAVKRRLARFLPAADVVR
jgi:arylsulfatase A-like enzyme